MRKLATFGAIWLAAAAVAVAVAWQGVGIVTRQVTDARPAPLEAAEVRALVEGTGPTTTVPASGADVPSTVVAPAGPAPTTSAPSTSPTTAATGVDRPPTSSPTSTTVAPPPTAPSTTAPPAAVETRTYHLTGGTVALRFSPDGVTVAFANPKPGFEVDVEPEPGSGVRVRFESDTHRSRVTGWWDGGPRDDVREDPR